MGDHLIDGEFQSDKYAWSRRGFVPLKVTDPMAQPVLWQYAQARRAVDAEFSADLEQALLLAGYKPEPGQRQATAVHPGYPDDPERDKAFKAIQLALGGARVTIGTALAAQIDSLGTTICAAATDRPNAGAIIECVGGDLRTAVDVNWDMIREQLAAFDRQGGNA